MNIMELGAIGELVGGVAVVASLLFVGIQVRGSARGQRAASLQEATRETANVVQYLTAPGISELWLTGMMDFRTLGPADRLRFSAVMVHFLRMFEQLYYQVRGDNVEHDVWVGFEQQLREIVNYPGFGTWWEDRGQWFSGAFRSLVESQMGAGDAPSIYEDWGAEA